MKLGPLPSTSFVVDHSLPLTCICLSLSVCIRNITSVGKRTPVGTDILLLYNRKSLLSPRLLITRPVGRIKDFSLTQNIGWHFYLEKELILTSLLSSKVVSVLFLDWLGNLVRISLLLSVFVVRKYWERLCRLNMLYYKRKLKTLSRGPLHVYFMRPSTLSAVNEDRSHVPTNSFPKYLYFHIRGLEFLFP